MPNKVLAIIVLLLSSVAFAQLTGSISGVVLDEAGAPIAGATVMYGNVPKFQTDSTGHRHIIGLWVQSAVKADSEGRFLIESLPEADWNLCAAGVLANQLRSCDWDERTVRVRIDSIRAVAAQTFQLRSGTLLRLQLDDPNGRLAAGATFFAVVVAPSGYAKRLELTSRNATQSHYAIGVPRSASLRLILDTSLSLADESDQTVPTRRTDYTISVGDQSENTIVLRVR